MCFASMMRAGYERLYRELHGEENYHSGDFTQWSKTPVVQTSDGPLFFPFDVMDGVRVRVSPDDEDPGDMFTTDKRAQPAALRPADETTEEG